MDEREVKERILCKWCLGKGTNRAVYGPVPCPDCYGTGRIEITEDEEYINTKE